MPNFGSSGSGLFFWLPPLQATAQLYEQGGLNHDMSFFLTAVAFYSLERPDVKVCEPSSFGGGGEPDEIACC